MKLRHKINSLSNHQFCIKPYNITQYDKLFANYPSRKQYLHHRSILTEGAKIGLTRSYPTRLTNNNPSFSVSEKMNGQQLKKWLETGIVLGPYTKDYAINDNISLHNIWRTKTGWLDQTNFRPL